MTFAHIKTVELYDNRRSLLLHEQGNFEIRVAFSTVGKNSDKLYIAHIERPYSQIQVADALLQLSELIRNDTLPKGPK